MADEPTQKNEVPKDADGGRPSSAFKVPPFSKTSADWVTLSDLERIDEDQITAPDLLREQCQRQGQPPPSDDEIAAFTLSLEEIKKEASNVVATLADQLAPKVRLAEQLGAKVVGISPAFSTLFGSLLNSHVGLPSMASAVRQFDQPQAIPSLRTTGQVTVEALARLQADLSAQESVTNSILEKMASNAQDASREQKHWNRRYFVVALATLGCALAALVVGVISLIG